MSDRIAVDQLVGTLRAIHAREEFGDCVEDGDPFPCRTIRLLDMFDPPPAPPTGPDCREGKHQACVGTAWDDVADAPVGCGCACHEGGAT